MYLLYIHYWIKKIKGLCMYSISSSFQDVRSKTKEISEHDGGPGPRLRLGLGSLLGRSGLAIIIIKTITIIITVMLIRNTVTIVVIILYMEMCKLKVYNDIFSPSLVRPSPSQSSSSSSMPSPSSSSSSE